MSYGSIPGIRVGQIFPKRQGLHDAGIHKGLMRGIAPGGEAIVLSGGYKDDKDDGNLIIYTGEGGRDPDTKAQITDQTLTGGNLALAKNFTQGNPIRVSRGDKLRSEYAPQKGYRYDGLYRIDDCWTAQGVDGFIIYKYRLIRLDGQPPLGTLEPKTAPPNSSPTPEGTHHPPHTIVATSRVIRNTEIGNQVKQLYDYKCQICGIQLVTPAGPYAECCHIQPLGKPHNGPDTLGNVLCLCPNHHVLFDTYTIHIEDGWTIKETGKKINTAKGHILDEECIRYHHTLGGMH